MATTRTTLFWILTTLLITTHGLRTTLEPPSIESGRTSAP